MQKTNTHVFQANDELSGYPLILQTLLSHRNITTRHSADNFLVPLYASLSKPETMHDMKKAVERIALACKENEHVAIYADYDADGIPGAIIMEEVLRALGHTNTTVYFPHRHDEGYGFHKEAIDELKEKNVTLIVTVDVGITNLSEVAYAQDHGIDCIVTDHHIPLDELPKGYAIVHPKIGDYADPMLCGAGVAYRLAQALLDYMRGKVHGVLPPEGWEKWSLDLVAIATISDMVPLMKENRVLALYGLRVLQKTRRPGLVALFKKEMTDLSNLSEEDISFMITPRINAASRMSHPKDAYDLLAARDTSTALVALEHLNKLNTQRKTLVAQYIKSAKKKVEEDSKIILVGDPEWNSGVVGLVAGRLVELYGKTAFVWGKGSGDLLAGSCRSCGDVDLVELMRTVDHVWERSGGHAEAGGFSVARKNIHTLGKILNDAYLSLEKQDRVSQVRAQASEHIPEMDLTLSDVDKSTFDIVARMAPFGMGNPKPLFAFRNVTIVAVKAFGKSGEHLEIRLKDHTTPTARSEKDAFGFFMTEHQFGIRLEPGAKVDLSGHLDYSTFRGTGRMRIRIIHISATA